MRNRGLAAVVGSIMLALGAGTASAQATQLVNTGYSLKGGAVDSSATPLGARSASPVISAVQRTVTTTTNMFSNAVGSVFGINPDPRRAELQKIASEGRWLANAGWPLYALCGPDTGASCCGTPGHSGPRDAYT